MSMPGYVKKALLRFQHPVPEKPEHQPYESAKPAYSAKVQYAKEVLESPKLNKEDKKFVQEVIGVFLFYRRTVDITTLCPLSAIAMDQVNPTRWVFIPGHAAHYGTQSRIPTRCPFFFATKYATYFDLRRPPLLTAFCPKF